MDQMKKGGAGAGAKSVPVKHRDMTRRSTDMTPVKRTPHKGPLHRVDSVKGSSTAGAGTPVVGRTAPRMSGRQQVGRVESLTNL